MYVINVYIIYVIYVIYVIKFEIKYLILYEIVN